MELSTALVLALPSDSAALSDGAPNHALAAGHPIRDELEAVTREIVDAAAQGISLIDAVVDPQFPSLCAFHRDLRDALLLEIPRDMEAWMTSRLGVPLRRAPQDAGSSRAPNSALAQGPSALSQLQRALVEHARPVSGSSEEGHDHDHALALLLVFEAVRLRLLVASWSSDEFESLGGSDRDLDCIAWTEVEALLEQPGLRADDVRPMHVLLASASLALARDAAHRAETLRSAGLEMRENLRMRARLKSALRELRLPESVLLENALSNILGEDRVELGELQATRPVALEGLSRQAMDQRVSRGRKALTGDRSHWPARRRPSLFDLFREVTGASPA